MYAIRSYYAAIWLRNKSLAARVALISTLTSAICLAVICCSELPTITPGALEVLALTGDRHPAPEQWQVGSLTGAVASRITSYNVCYTKLLRILGHL